MKGPEKIANILADLMARRGYGRVQSTEAYEEAWREVAGDLAAKYTRVGGFSRGNLEIVVANSVLIQELTYQKTALLQGLNDRLPQQNIRGLKFRVGTLE